jgi:alanine dehydrogenase
MGSLYQDNEEEALHRDAIEALAQEVRQPVANVKTVYENEFFRLKSDARVHDYLPLFASRRARETLLRKQA